MLPDKTYILRFFHNDGEIEEVEHTDWHDANYHFSLFIEEDTSEYNKIQLIEYDWVKREEEIIANIG